MDARIDQIDDDLRQVSSSLDRRIAHVQKRLKGSSSDLSGQLRFRGEEKRTEWLKFWQRRTSMIDGGRGVRSASGSIITIYGRSSRRALSL